MEIKEMQTKGGDSLSYSKAGMRNVAADDQDPVEELRAQTEEQETPHEA